MRLKTKFKQFFCNHITDKKVKKVKVDFDGYLVNEINNNIIETINSITFKYKICEKCGKEIPYKQIFHCKVNKPRPILGHFLIIDLNYKQVSNKELLSGKYPMRIL